MRASRLPRARFSDRPRKRRSPAHSPEAGRTLGVLPASPGRAQATDTARRDRAAWVIRLATAPGWET
jgi:hypothetical protein